MEYVIAAVNTLAAVLFVLWQIGTALWRAGRRSPLVAEVIRRLRWPALGALLVMIACFAALGVAWWFLVAFAVLLGLFWASDWGLESRGVQR